jgi:hypothetical protein
MNHYTEFPINLFRMRKIYLVVILLFLLIGASRAQINSVTLLNSPVLQYEKAEWEIRLTAQWGNPYLQEDIALDMLIVTPGGRNLVLPCYFESGESGLESVWKARFAPQEKGKYSYCFRLAREGKSEIKSDIYKFTSGKSSGNGFLKPKDNWTLQFDNGKPFRGIGENICWESRTRDDSKFFRELHENTKYNYDYMLPLLAKNGGNFYRTWMCSWNLPLDWKKGINNSRYSETDEYYNPSAIKRFDRMINLADSLGIYVMLTLGQGASRISDGGFAVSAADFFVNPQSKERYKNRLRYIVGRWGYSTSICAWELFNEIDNVQFSDRDNPIPAESIVAWHDEMSAYIKQIDPYKHLVTTSISHRDLKGLNSLKNIDINQKHIYKNTASIPGQIVKYEAEFGKPYVIGEFGFEWDWSKNFDDFATDMDLDFKHGLWFGMFAPTPILPMSWWWEYFENRGMMSYFRGVREISDQMLKAGNGSFENLDIQSDQVNARGVKCGKTCFIYLLNETDEAITSSIHFPAGSAQKLSVESFDPVSLKYNEITDYEIKEHQAFLHNLKLESKNERILIVTIK